MDLKDEVFRLLDPRWQIHRSYFLRQNGYTWVEIAVALNYHESTIRGYVKKGQKEAVHVNTLHFHLTERTRKWINAQGVDPTATDAADRASALVMRYAGRRRVGLGAATRNEILNAVDVLRESQRLCLTSSVPLKTEA